MHSDAHDGHSASRRHFLRVSGTTLLLIPVVNLAGCSESTPETPSAPAGTSSAPAPSTSTPTPAAPAQAAPAPAALVKLDENDSTAVTLGYKHSAADVNADRYARYEAGQTCSNCSLFLPGDSPEPGWGACSIFPGKLVNAGGWCNVYVAKA